VTESRDEGSVLSDQSTFDDYEAVKEELKRLRVENKKLSRQLVVVQDMVNRNRLSTRITSSLYSIKENEKLNQDIFFNLVLRNSPDIILILDEDGRFLYCTDSFLNKLGVSNFELISGRMLSDVFMGFLNAAEIEHLNSAIAKSLAKKETATLDMEIDFLQEDRLRSYTISFTPMDNSNDDTIGVMALFHDMTDLLHAQQFEAASRAKSVFLATMSHEIRTPLNAVIGLADIQLQKQLPQETRMDLEKIRLSGTTLLGIINDILDISKIEAGSFELVPADYDLPKLIDDIVQLNIVRIGSKNIAFELQVDDTIPAKLYGDELRVKQILNNLLSNAFKYTKEGKVMFRVSWRRQDESAELTFGVDDTGMGIKEEDLKKLFMEYIQLDMRANRNIEGTGLGLSIAHKLAEMMGGTVTVQSLYGVGSSFEVFIRQEISDETPIGEKIARDLENHRYIARGSKSIVRADMSYGKVLVVDDVPTNLDVARGLMLPYGLTIDFAGSGQEAIEKIREGKLYDVVFMDHMMPKMDGIEATRIIRDGIGTEYARTVPIIALTANALVGNREMFLANGFNDFLSKPIDIVKLDAVLNQWVRDKQSEETLRLAEQAKDQTKTEENKQSVIRSMLDELKVNGVDFAVGIERYNDEAVYLSMLTSFANHTPKLLSKLREIDEKNLPEYATTVHGIKGSAYGICAHEVGRRAEALELAAKAGNFEAVRLDNEAFIKFVEILIADLAEFLRQTDEAEKESRAKTPKKRLPAPDREFLQELLKATSHFKTYRMEEIMAELEMYEYETGGELITWLRKQMDELEYNVIQERLSLLLNNTE